MSSMNSGAPNVERVEQHCSQMYGSNAASPRRQRLEEKDAFPSTETSSAGARSPRPASDGEMAEWLKAHVRHVPAEIALLQVGSRQVLARTDVFRIELQ
jgi:hypothetical protein